MTTLPTADQQTNENAVAEREEAQAISEAVKQHIAAVENSAIDDEEAEALLASLYYDAGTMSALNPKAEVRLFLFTSLLITCTLFTAILVF
jgi:hypothetical protein